MLKVIKKISTREGRVLKIEIRQGMREDELKGITNVGMQVLGNEE